MQQSKNTEIRMNRYTASVLGGGFCWGFMGFFTRHLADYGIDANGAIVVRCGIAAVCFAILILCTGPGDDTKTPQHTCSCAEAEKPCCHSALP